MGLSGNRLHPAELILNTAPKECGDPWITRMKVKSEGPINRDFAAPM